MTSSYDPNDPTSTYPAQPTHPAPSYPPPASTNTGTHTGLTGAVGPTGDSHVHEHRSDSDDRAPHWMEKVNHFMPLAMAALLAMILLTLVIDFVADEEERDEMRDGICALVTHAQDNEGALAYTEMDPQQRSVADSFDCDVEGR